MSDQLKSGKKIVIKIGTGVLTRGGAREVDHAMIARLAQSIAELVKNGHQCVMVSSGAVGAGVMYFELKERPAELSVLQACASAGQAMLMHLYESQFSLHKVKIAQLLLTHSNFKSEQRINCINNTLSTLLSFPDVVPIVNENDSVATFELKVGDNDTLSSKVAQLIEADLLILLTSVDGLLDDNDQVIPEVGCIEDVFSFAKDETGALSVGGMASKLKAVQTSVEAGIETVIASGFNPEQLEDLVAGHGVGTRFAPLKKA